MARIQVYCKDGCTSCKKTFDFLDRHKLEYDSINILDDPPPRSVLDKAINGAEVKRAFNTRSKSYKEMDIANNIPAKADAIKLMQENPGLIKRPVIVKGGTVLIGFDESALQTLL